MAEQVVEATDERPLDVVPPATAAGKRQRRATEAVWVVQVRREIEFDESNGEEHTYVTRVLWEDIATVKVPPSTKRPRIFKLALEQAGIKAQVGVAPPTMRALDADSSHEVTPEVDVQLKIG